MKKFLKQNLRKIIITITLSFFIFILFLSCNEIDTQPGGWCYPYGIPILYILKNGSFIDGLMILALSIIVSFAISCLVEWIDNKLKNKVLITLLIIALYLFFGYSFLFYPGFLHADGPRDPQIKAAIDMLKNEAQEYKQKNNTYIGFDSSEKSLELKEYIKERGEPSALIIYSSKDKYCIQKTLWNQRKVAWFKEVPTYFCIDYTGYAGSDINYNGCDSVNFDCKNDN